MKKMKAHPKKKGLSIILSLALIAIIILVYKLDIMIKFMGFAFLGLGLLKFYNLKAFATAYAAYDPIASKSKTYAYAYPFIELALGFMYLFNWNITAAAAITVFIMTVDGIGVGRTLFKKQTLYCACVGTLFKIPLTTFTLTEDIGMGLMALLILLA